MIAITGAAGYVGGLLAAALARRGVAVRRLVRAPDVARGEAYFALEQPVPPGTLAGVDVLVHAAHDFGPLHEEELRRVNVDGSRRLFDAATRDGVKRVVFISSLAAWEGCRSAYGRVKWTLEQDLASRGGTSVRPGMVFGRASGGLFAALDRVVRRVPLVPDFGPGARLWVVHAEDLTLVLTALVSGSPMASGPLGIAHPDVLTLRAVTEVIAAAAGRRARFVPAPAVLALAGLRTVEAAGVRLPFRSDSLVSLLNGNPAPDLASEVLGVRLRPLDAHTFSE